MMYFKSCCYALFVIVLLIGCKPIKMMDLADYEAPKESINSNNKIYKEGVKVLFDYYFIQGQDTLKCNGLTDELWTSSIWEMVKLQDTIGTKKLIDKMSLKVAGDLSFDQTRIKFNLLSSSLKPYKNLWSETRLIENEQRVWISPNRNYQLYITEFNPFPEIRYPLKKGTIWTDTISAFPSPIYDNWVKFDERIDCFVTYEITGKTKLKTNLGKLTCYITEATAVNPHGKGHLTSYFNEKYGFVKWDYTNIDGSRLVMNLIDFEEK